MSQVYNFSPGPAMLPVEVMAQAQAEFRDWQHLGMSVMEVSHRGKEFTRLVEQSESDLRELLAIPAHYQVLFLAGGATAQFSMVPLNLLGDKTDADYVNTGQWSEKAIAEASRYCNVNVVTQYQKTPQFRIPPQREWSLNPQAAYLHFTPNETINGVEFHWLPDAGSVPLVADMSSTILSRPIDVSRYGVIYAGAQKNMGAAGITVVIINPDCLREPLARTPILYQYPVEIKNKSLYNTPTTYSWYLTSLVLAWLKRQGGLAAMAERNQRKAEKLYRFIDQHSFYINPVHPDCRSWMNVPFSLANPELNDTFLTLASEAGLANLKGHKLVGGMRASIYNAMPEAGVDLLISFMQDFAAQFH